LRAPGGVEELEVVDVRYLPIEVDPYTPTEVAFPLDRNGNSR
jgi:hypothetical protein